MNLQRGQCPIVGSGYICDRLSNHGALHYDAFNATWWIQQPHDDDESMGRKPITGYLLINDIVLPQFIEKREP